MKCAICYGDIKLHRTCLLGKDICSLCMKSIGDIDVNNIFYDYYKDKIKNIVGFNLLPPLPQQP